MTVPADANKRRLSPALWLGCCLMLALAALVYPMYVIRPFRYQGPRELSVALAVLRIRPWLEIFLIALACALELWSWRTYRRLGSKILATALALLVLLCGILSRVNIYERMFHPLERAAFALASQSKLDGAEMVIAVNIRGMARAYPIRSMSYHHIVNDVIGGVPIVATY